MFKSKLYIMLIIPCSFLLMSWGYQGHQKVSGGASLSYNAQMNQFHNWTATLISMASEADNRKGWDPDESPKHYIDIDFYNDFNNTGRIPQTMDSLIYQNGYFTVYENGILPFATEITFDSLKQCLMREDWNKAVLFAADLGHYVGDGHMPLHITLNYNGQETGNTGIHSRFESSMINTYIESITYTGSEVAFIDNVNQYIFNYIYKNHYFVDSIIDADNYATAIAGNTNSSTYRQALWEKSKYYTIDLFKNGSHALAELIYTAWVMAGSPAMPSQGIDDDRNLYFSLDQNSPNPFNLETKIQLTVNQSTPVELFITDALGNYIQSLVSEVLMPGEYNFAWNALNRPSGLYYLNLSNRKRTITKKMILMN